MMTAKNFISELSAIAYSGRFTAYSTGVAANLPTGESLNIKIKRTLKAIRPVGLRLSKYGFVTEVSAGDHVGVGYGEDESQLMAVQKSIAEGVERVVYRAVKETAFGTTNSNGWAAHINSKKAFGYALDELLERDAVLVHWLCKEPMVEVNHDRWPKWLRHFAAEELALGSRFKRLRILVSDKGHIPTATTILLDQYNFAVLSHATAPTLENAIYKALVETCRIAHMAIENISVESSMKLKDRSNLISASPEDHAMFYAFHEKFPEWIYGKKIEWRAAVSDWQSARSSFRIDALKPKFNQIASGPLVIGYATCNLTQGLFFGQTEFAQKYGFINYERLKSVGHVGDFNLMPHCVP